MFTKEKFIEMLKKAVDKIEEKHEYLSELDAATGDGDHGITIYRTMKAVREAANNDAALPFNKFIETVSMKVMMCDGGSTSPLLGSFFMGLAPMATSDNLSAEETAKMFEAGLAGFFGISKASIGDKTMMDALKPAIEILAIDLRAGKCLKESFNAAAVAAALGAESTKAFIAKFGRARTMGERAIGHIDAGATSISLIFEGFAEAA